MKLLAGLVLALLPFAAQPLPQLDHPFSLPTNAAEQLESIHRRGWAIACELKKTNCSGWPMPVVAYTLMDAYGKYQIGSRVVLIDLRMYGQEFGALVMIHEMIHYIQAMKRPMVVEVNNEMGCADEKEAHELVFAFAMLNDVAKDDPRLKDWTSARALTYGCKE